MSRVTGALVVAAVTGAALWVAGPAGASTIDVFPGHRAIQRAIDRADAGDTLRIHPGRYHGEVEVDKRVTLVGVGPGVPTIDAHCNHTYVVDVEHAGVVVRNLRLVGGSYAQINFVGIPEGAAKDLVMRDTCDALYGVNVYGSQRIAVVGNSARGFSDAGIYIGGIVSTGGGKLKVRDNETYHNNRGIFVEQISGGTLVVRGNDSHDNDIVGGFEPASAGGIVLNKADGILIDGNITDSNGSYGIFLDDESDTNVLNGNDAGGNGIADFHDEGTGNCGSGNSFTIPACT